MSKLLTYYCFIGLICCLMGCTTSKTTVSANVDLSKYKYASIINNETYHIPAELMEYEIQLYDAVESSSLQIISDRRIHELTPQQQSELLLVKYGVNQNEDEAVVTVNFIDFMTGRPVVSCRGAYILGLAASGNLRGAINNVGQQISQTFPNK